MNIRRPGLLNIPIKELRKKTVCSKHFEDRMFSNYQKNRLYPDAVPTLNIINNRYEGRSMTLGCIQNGVRYLKLYKILIVILFFYGRRKFWAKYSGAVNV